MPLTSYSLCQLLDVGHTLVQRGSADALVFVKRRQAFTDELTASRAILGWLVR